MSFLDLEGVRPYTRYSYQPFPLAWEWFYRIGENQEFLRSIALRSVKSSITSSTNQIVSASWEQIVLPLSTNS